MAPIVSATTVAPPVSPEVAVPTQQPEVPQSPAQAAPKQLDSERFAALSRKEKEILRRGKEIKQREAMLKQQYAPYDAWKQAAEVAKTNKLEAIKHLGISYEDLTNEYLQREAPTPEMVAKKVAEETINERLKSYQADQQKHAEAAQAQQYEQAKSQIVAEAREVVSAGNYPFVKSTEEYDTVFEYIKQEYDKTNKVMSVEDALRDVNEYFKEETMKLAEHLPLDVVDALRSKLLPKEPVPKQTGQPQAPTTPTQQRTLTHKTTTAPAASKPSTPEERRKRAEDIFYGRA